MNKTEDIKIQKLAGVDIDEFRQLIEIFNDEFAAEKFEFSDTSHLQHLLAKPNFLAITVKSNGKVIGGLTAYILDQYVTAKPLIYIYDVAVARPHQRKGVGRALMEYLKMYGKENHFAEIFVQADKEDNKAREFYRAIGPAHEKKAVDFSYWL